MSDPVIDHAPSGALPKTSTLNEHVRSRQSAAGILNAFTKSGTIPTGYGNGSQRRAPAPVRPAAPSVFEAEEMEVTPAAPQTLADLRRQMGGTPSAPEALEEDDGGFNASALSPRRSKPKSGATLAAGALKAMRKQR